MPPVCMFPLHVAKTRVVLCMYICRPYLTKMPYPSVRRIHLLHQQDDSSDGSLSESNASVSSEDTLLPANTASKSKPTTSSSSPSGSGSASGSVSDSIGDDSNSYSSSGSSSSSGTGSSTSSGASSSASESDASDGDGSGSAEETMSTETEDTMASSRGKSGEYTGGRESQTQTESSSLSPRSDSYSPRSDSASGKKKTNKASVKFAKGDKSKLDEDGEGGSSSGSSAGPRDDVKKQAGNKTAKKKRK